MTRSLGVWGNNSIGCLSQRTQRLFNAHRHTAWPFIGWAARLLIGGWLCKAANIGLYVT